jgi:hypothetical protein
MNKTLNSGTKFYTVLKPRSMRRKGHTARMKEMKNTHNISPETWREEITLETYM